MFTIPKKENNHMANDMREQYKLLGKLFLIITYIFRQKEEDRKLHTYMITDGGKMVKNEGKLKLGFNLEIVIDSN